LDIRALSQIDLPALVSLYRHLHRSDEPLPSQEVVERVWAEVMASDRYAYFGGFIGEELVSTCAIAVIPNLTRGCRPYGVIENVVTHASHRRRGYGTALLRATLAYAWREGCYKVMLMTGRKDDETFRFYRSVGFDSDEKQAFVANPAA
jgi:GNAT superfamily N-acetyltransferase